MESAVVVLAVLGYGLLLKRSSKWPLESSLLFVCASMLCLLYFSGLLGCLHLAAQVMLGIGVLLFLTGILSRLKSGTLAPCLSPGVLFFLLSVLGFWFFTRSNYYANLSEWDDFSHWGRISKIIAGNHRLIIPADAVWLQDYPPGMALFDYLFFQFSGFSERIAMFSRGVFVFAAFSQLFSVIPGKFNKYSFAGISLFLYSLIFFLKSGLHTVSADLIVSVVFGSAIFGYLADRQNGRLAALIRLVPLVMLLPLIKLIGGLFAFIIIGVVICDILAESISVREKTQWLFAAILLITLCLFTHLSWSSHVKRLGASKTFNAEISVHEIVKALDPASATDRQKTTIGNFTRRVFFPYLDSEYGTCYKWALCLAFLWLLWFMSKDHRKFIPLAVLFAGFCAYLVVLLVLYMFSFGDYEGVRLAEFKRYVNTYSLGVFIVLFGLALSLYFKEKRGKTTAIFFVAICIVTMIPNLKAGLRSMSSTVRGSTSEGVTNISRHWNMIEENTAPSSKIYFVCQNISAEALLIFGYGIIPRRTNQGCWSVGLPYYDGDVWTCPMAPGEFEKALRDYDYLFIARGDKKLEDVYLSQMGISNAADGSLFKVSSEADHLKLRRIQTVSKS